MTSRLASVAAGGLLRDLARERGSASLSVVHRFSDPAEAAASLAIRAGDPTSLGYYTDHARVHVGDPATAADQAYLAGWATADWGSTLSCWHPPARLVIQLNERARLDRLAGDTADPAANLTDGTQASAGDVIVTRHNDRRLVVSDTDWVKNGDRWRITSVHPDGSLRAVALTSSRRAVRLPADYVAQHVQLGYATTVHAAQGMTVDTCHTVVDGAETRQLLYVALSRGRHQNHVYLGRNDMAEIPQEAPTPLDVLRAMLGHDDAEVSATTARRISAAPGGRLTTPPTGTTTRSSSPPRPSTEQEPSNGSTQNWSSSSQGSPARPPTSTLRGRLAVFALDDHDPITLVRDARNYAPLDTAHDLAAVLGYRLVPQSPGPLPWLPAVPHRIANDPEWGTYLHGRDALIRELADQVALSAAATSQPPNGRVGCPRASAAKSPSGEPPSRFPTRTSALPAKRDTAARLATSNSSTSGSGSPASERPRTGPTGPPTSPSS
ncbi:MAG: AAA family ATPase [Nocardioidaceae bacterium]